MGAGSTKQKPTPAEVNEPWREVRCKAEPWTMEHLDELRKAIPEISYMFNGENIKGSIAVVGQVQAGKSSFINSALSGIEDRLVQVAPEGDSDKSYTQELNKFVCGNFLVSDTMGLELKLEFKGKEGREVMQQGIQLQDIEYMATGHVPVYYKFDSSKPITPESEDFIKEPGNTAGVHCFVFVVDASVEVPSDIVENIRELQTKIAAIAGGIPRIVILTKIDKLDAYVEKDIGKTFHSSKVKRAVKVASEIYRIPERFIYPVKNLTHEPYPTTKATILIMMALKGALEYANDRVKKLNQNNE